MALVPHSGYHWHGGSDRFFEGWYFRVTLPQARQSFVFMYAIDDPQGHTPYSGGSAQVLGIDEQLIWRTLPNTGDFRADYDACWLEHWGAGDQGYRVSDRHNQGMLKDPATGKFCTWDYEITTISTWGSFTNLTNSTNGVAKSGRSSEPEAPIDPGISSNLANSPRHNQQNRQINEPRSRLNTEPLDRNAKIYRQGQATPRQTKTSQKPKEKPRAVMGILSYLSVFEPGWQILQSHAIASGQINWCGDVYKFTNAPAYSEKNWGRTFPDKWFWLQCNSFASHPTLSITAAGGRREFVGQPTNVAMVSIHYQNQFWAFLPEDSQIYCQVKPWGEWHIYAHKNKINADRSLTWVQVIGWCDRPGNQVLVPTATGLKLLSTDTLNGQIQLNLSSPGLQLRASDNQAALEIGGDPWPEPWQFKSAQI
ncbi:tocopherol cyclase [Thalassoporum mexicanum PCC 7367]|uniref:tocopherol cyclase family protein n=1 Tax=Thalassoporum mexicanum TaxID=3457544 RepID=UPI00029F80C5|nr:tocopherol cyclase family protein [Pseudanabaena sp. PCC 7367]AFY69362.1 tocopherol cyclase [Pseudanabaena sp. PCC 7367]